MIKQLIDDVFIIDRCHKCGGVWLDKSELEIIKKRSSDAGWNAGFTIGMLFT